MKFTTFDAKTATTIALPPITNQPLFSDTEAATLNPIAKYMISETCTALSCWLLLTKTDAILYKIDYKAAFAMMRVCLSSLPFQAPHEKSFGWLRGLLAAALPAFAVPATLFEKTNTDEDFSHLLSHRAHEYTGRLCQEIGAILYDYADETQELLTDLFQLSTSDAEEIQTIYLRYLSFAMQSFERAMQEPAPMLVGYPYPITHPTAEQDAAEDTDDFEILYTSYTPSIQCYCVWDARREAYIEHALWQGGRFIPIFTESDADLFPTATATFLDTTSDALHENADRSDLEEMASLYQEDAGTEETPSSMLTKVFDELFYPDPEEDNHQEDCDDDDEAAMLDELFSDESETAKFPSTTSDLNDLDEDDFDGLDEDDFDNFDEDGFDSFGGDEFDTLDS